MDISSPPVLRFGPYEIVVRSDGWLHELGRGGFGCTYLAEHVPLMNRVALKVLDARHAVDDHTRRRFLKKAREQAALDHQGIAQILDCGEEKGKLWYALELCEYGNLREFVARYGELSEADTFHLMLQAAEALRYAHHKQRLHLDLKPGNLMLKIDLEGRPVLKLIDFGLEQCIPGDAGKAPRYGEGGPLFSPAFASPEQVLAHPPDPRSDLFSLGLTAWYLLTGENPDKGSPEEVRKARVSDEEYESRLPRKLTDAGRALLARLIRKEPAERFASAAELVDALRKVLATQPPLGRDWYGRQQKSPALWEGQPQRDRLLSEVRNTHKQIEKAAADARQLVKQVEADDPDDARRMENIARGIRPLVIQSEALLDELAGVEGTGLDLAASRVLPAAKLIFNDVQEAFKRLQGISNQTGAMALEQLVGKLKSLVAEAMKHGDELTRIGREAEQAQRKFPILKDEAGQLAFTASDLIEKLREMQKLGELRSVSVPGIRTALEKARAAKREIEDRLPEMLSAVEAVRRRITGFEVPQPQSQPKPRLQTQPHPELKPPSAPGGRQPSQNESPRPSHKIIWISLTAAAALAIAAGAWYFLRQSPSGGSGGTLPTFTAESTIEGLPVEMASKVEVKSVSGKAPPPAFFKIRLAGEAWEKRLISEDDITVTVRGEPRSIAKLLRKEKENDILVFDEPLSGPEAKQAISLQSTKKGILFGGEDAFSSPVPFDFSSDETTECRIDRATTTISLKQSDGNRPSWYSRAILQWDAANNADYSLPLSAGAVVSNGKPQPVSTGSWKLQFDDEALTDGTKSKNGKVIVNRTAKTDVVRLEGSSQKLELPKGLPRVLAGVVQGEVVVEGNLKNYVEAVLKRMPGIKLPEQADAFFTWASRPMRLRFPVIITSKGNSMKVYSGFNIGLSPSRNYRRYFTTEAAACLVFTLLSTSGDLSGFSADKERDELFVRLREEAQKIPDQPQATKAMDQKNQVKLKELVTSMATYYSMLAGDSRFANAVSAIDEDEWELIKRWFSRDFLPSVNYNLTEIQPDGTFLLSPRVYRESRRAPAASHQLKPADDEHYEFRMTGDKKSNKWLKSQIQGKIKAVPAVNARILEKLGKGTK